MKKIPVWLLFSLFLIVYLPTSSFASSTVQQQIDEAKNGDIITLPDGIFAEHIVIDKAITLIGSDNTIFTANDQAPIITIEADDVTLKQLTLQSDIEDDTPAIALYGSHNKLDNITIDTKGIGIKLDGAHKNELVHITIHGDPNIPLAKRQHGMDLWKSNHNTIQDTTIKNVKDGIYMESSDHTNVHHNEISHSRYGYHLMFTKQTTLEHNESYENVSGMMIMGTNGTVASHNTLHHNQKNVQSLGLLLFDVENATITNNEITNNRVGIFVEEASRNDIAENHVQGNYIGLQFKGATQNTIYHNAFTANVVQGQAEDSTNNHTNENFWGDHIGLDTTGDQMSNIAYEVDPFFLQVTDAYPPFQLLFQSPGMIFLEQLLHTPKEERFIDQSPLMHNPLVEGSAGDTSRPSLVFVVSFSLFFVSIIIIFMGVTHNEKKI